MIPDPQGVRAIRGLLIGIPLAAALWVLLLTPALLIWSIR